MTRIAPQPGPEIGGAEPPAVVRVTPSMRAAAVARLLGCAAHDAAPARFIRSAAEEGTDLSLMWATLRPPQVPGRAPEVGEACLVIPGSGRTAMVFVSGSRELHAAGGPRPRASTLARPAPDAATLLRERGVLVARVAEVLEAGADAWGVLPEGAGRVRLAQALVEPEQEDLVAALERGGFARLADLSYMRRELPRRAAGGEIGWPDGVEVRAVAALGEGDGEAALSRALQRSYVQTLDCPALCGMRETADVLESHRSVGVFDPSLWWVVFLRGEAEGCMLLSACPPQDTAELVYIGLGPGLRGKGLARGLLTMGADVLAGRGVRNLACAVDTRNTPALRLYKAQRFRAFAARVAMVRPIRTRPEGGRPEGAPGGSATA